MEKFAKFSMRENWKKDPPKKQNQALIPPTPKTNRTMVISVSGGWWSGIFLSLFLFSKGQLFEEKKENRPPISDFFWGENSPFCFFFLIKRSQVTWSRELFRKFPKKSSHFISKSYEKSSRLLEDLGRSLVFLKKSPYIYIYIANRL